MLSPGEDTERELDGSDHEPRRPWWTCRACGQEWPCKPARDEMMTGTSIAVAIAAWSYFEDAVDDLPAVPGLDLYDRFIGWTRLAYQNGAGLSSTE